jgi:sensor c-di-GMP phosphodiesterase-like protein
LVAVNGAAAASPQNRSHARVGARHGRCGMLAGLRNLFSSGPAPYADPKASIPLGEVLRRNWFELWYQPKIELRTMHLVGAEALVRARHPTRGIVPPIFFLPDASVEDMHALTERVILTALRDWENFAHYGVPIKLAVNVPVSALVDLPIPRMLREMRPRAANWPGLTLEVTEDQIIDDLDLAKDVAEALRELKCDLSVDLACAVEAIAVQRAQDRSQLRRQLQC